MISGAKEIEIEERQKIFWTHLYKIEPDVLVHDIFEGRIIDLYVGFMRQIDKDMEGLMLVNENLVDNICWIGR